MRRKKRKKRPSCLHVEAALDEDKPDLAIGLKPTRELPIGLDVCRVQDGLQLRVHRPPSLLAANGLGLFRLAHCLPPHVG